MKKSSFIEGTIIATLAIIFVKILGMLYVIPFYRIVGKDGGALYSYAYNIYLIFLSISSAGLPIAISKVISEYDTLGYKEAKNRAYHIAKKIISIISIVAFIFLFIFAEEIGHFIIGSLKGTNTYKDVAFVIRCVSPSILIIPFLSITKGYLQGHKYISPSSLSELLEQVVRIFIILCGSYLCMKVIQAKLSLTIGIAVSGAFFGGLVAYIYLKRVIKKHKEELNFKEFKEQDEISSKEITKKIITYAIPFVIINVVTHIYNFTDQILVLRTLEFLKYNPKDIEFIASSISTWSPKICTIITAFANGMAIALIPTIASSYAKKDFKEVEENVNKALSLVISISLPISIGICILGDSVWSIFYAADQYGWMILRIAVFSSLLSNVYLILSSILQSLNKFKYVYIVSIVGFVTNGLLDIPIMLLFNKLGLNGFLGSVVSSIIGYTLSISIGLLVLKKNIGINYKKTLNITFKNFIPSIAMILVLYALNLILPFNRIRTFGALITIMINGIVGASVYLVIAYKLGIIKYIFGEQFINKIIKKLTRGKLKKN